MRWPSRPAPSPMGAFTARMHRAGRLVVQPRMGFTDVDAMRRGLLATRAAAPATIGTITVDSYTRTGDQASARRAIEDGRDLNGYPLAAYPAAVTAAMLDGVPGPDFPVQVRHGSARPGPIIRAMTAVGLSATEGGPVSYCLPYGRVPLAESIENWRQACELLAAARDRAGEPHLETFGGCMMGQLCPPGLLVAVSVLEAMFFRRHGIRSLSLSYAQQTHPGQDAEAIAALRALAARFLPGTEYHLVLYAYMGAYPRTAHGARGLLAAAARLALATGVERLIVKTTAEAHRIPTITENVTALQLAASASAGTGPLSAPPAGSPPAGADSEVYTEALALIERTLDLSGDIGAALGRAFGRGYLDVPYCLHPDNAGRSESYLGADGRLRWAAAGAMPIPADPARGPRPRVTSAALLASLHYLADGYDRAPDPALAADQPGPAPFPAIGVNQ
jgi:methylaspartate mutase epsilon subunit